MLPIFKSERFSKLNNNWLFECFIVFLYFVVSVIGWKFSYSYAGMGIVSLTLILLFVFNDFKYAIPAVIYIIFSYNGGYESTQFPGQIVLYGSLLIVLIILFTIFNFKKENFKKPISYIGISLLTVFCIIPIFWNEVITDNKMLYALYFTWVLYIVVFLVFLINLGKNSLRIFIFTFCFLAVLIAIECFLKLWVYHNEDPSVNILSFGYHIGWGVNNEAGIMILFCMPFIVYALIKSPNVGISAIILSILGVSVIGLILTNSRGTYLFGAIELLALFILTIIYSKKRITNLILLLMFVGLGILGIHFYYGLDKLFKDVLNYVFSNGLESNSRFELWERAFNLWKRNPLTIIFGSGIISEMQVGGFTGFDTVYTVYHSTFFETLTVAGSVGIIALAFHFFEKYKQIFKYEKEFMLVLLVGYLFLDLYGMIDNTYGMYYYMVPLVILMASLDNPNQMKLFEN